MNPEEGKENEGSTVSKAGSTSLKCSVCALARSIDDLDQQALNCGNLLCTGCLRDDGDASDEMVCPSRKITKIDEGDADDTSQQSGTGKRTLDIDAASHRNDAVNKKVAPEIKRARKMNSLAASPLNVVGSRICVQHAQESAGVLCEDCGRGVCCLCMITTCKNHRLHAIEGIAHRILETRVASCLAAGVHCKSVIEESAFITKAHFSHLVDCEVERLKFAVNQVCSSEQIAAAASFEGMQVRINSASSSGGLGIAGGNASTLLLQALSSNYRQLGIDFEPELVASHAVHLGRLNILSFVSEEDNKLRQDALAVTSNSEEAFKLYSLAAGQGSAEGQVRLGGMHLNGLSVVRDNAEAFKLYSLAAGQGSAEAQVIMSASHLVHLGSAPSGNVGEGGPL